MPRLPSRARTPSALERLTGAGLAAGRLAIGAGLWLVPRVALGALGFPEPSRQALTLARIAATRDLVLGAWQLHSRGDREELRRASLAVAAADAADALAFALALGEAESRTAARRGVLSATPAALAGAWLATRLRG